MNVFEIFRTWAAEPVTIVAEFLDDALRIFEDWVDKHHPSHSEDPGIVHPFTTERLRARPHLAALAARSRPGIAYWSRTACRWTVGPAWAAALLDLAEPEPRVSYFQFDSEERSDFMIFAETLEHATSIYCAAKLHLREDLPKQFSVKKMSRWDLRGDFATLRDDMVSEVCGVGRVDNLGFWRILPLD